MEDKNFAKFIYFNKPHQNAPGFVLGKVVIKKEEFITWLMGQDTIEGYVKLDVKQPKDSSKNPYMEVDTYVKPTDSTPVAEPVAQTDNTDDSDSLPF